MGGTCHARSRHRDPLWDSTPTSNVGVRRIETHGATHGAVLAGLDPGLLDRGARTSVLSRIGSLAGNAAAAALVSRVRTDQPLDAPGGVREIRRVAGGGTLGHTRLSMDPTPPTFRLPSPETAQGGYAVRPGRTRASELEFVVRWPSPGRHVLYEATSSTGSRANTYLEVNSDWSGKILKGEEEHVGDQTIAWRCTWKRVADVVNQMATEPPVTGATPDAARRAAWARFVARLPAQLRPDGVEPSESAQLAKWDFADPNSAFRTLIGESKRARDLPSPWHTPEASLDHMEGDNEVRSLSPGNSQIDVTKPEDLMKAAWTRLLSTSSGGGRRGR
jgi:hypothetical protein